MRECLRLQPWDPRFFARTTVLSGRNCRDGRVVVAIIGEFENCGISAKFEKRFPGLSLFLVFCCAMSEASSSGNSSSKAYVGSGGRPLQIGDEIPNFTCDSHMGMITLHSFIDGGWGVIFTWASVQWTIPLLCLRCPNKRQFDDKHTQNNALTSLWLGRVNHIENAEGTNPRPLHSTGVAIIKYCTCIRCTQKT